MPATPRILISYARKDGADFTASLRERLRKEHPGITLWQDVISERAGPDWWPPITEALDVEYMRRLSVLSVVDHSDGLGIRVHSGSCN